MPQKNVGDNWNFVEELLKLTCNPKVSAGCSFGHRTIKECYILRCRLNRLSVCVAVTARFTGGTHQDARSLLSQSQPAVGTQHQRCFHSLGVLQQESGE